jgi:hypothetical protein
MNTKEAEGCLKNTQLNIRTTKEVARAVRSIAALRGEKLGDFLERLLEQEIKKHKLEILELLEDKR